MHHSRRKSGHISANTSMTDVRKAVGASDLSKQRRPQLSRKSTPQTAQKLGKSPRHREKEWEEERWWEDDRESFPQFCMACEKQFVPQDVRCLYCSDACKRHDLNMSATASHSPTYATGYGGHLPFYASGDPEPRDIVPRASPSRPNSMYWSPPATPTNAQYTNAISSLKSLSVRPPSPPSPVSGHSSLWPFTRSAATSPSTSYNKHSTYSSTYDGGYTTSGYGYSTAGVSSSNRPLPSRKPGHRPKSIELVTPMVGR